MWTLIISIQFTRCVTSGSKLKTTFHSTCSTTATRGTRAPFVVRNSTHQQIFPSMSSFTSHPGTSVRSAGRSTTTGTAWPSMRKVISVRLMGRVVEANVFFFLLFQSMLFKSFLFTCFRSKPTSIKLSFCIVVVLIL